MTEDKPKKKRLMTPIMLENLKIAREKALEVRARLKSSETEQIAHAKQKIKNKGEPIKGKKERIKALAEAELNEELNNLKLNVKEPIEPPEKNKEKELKEKIKVEQPKEPTEEVEEITPPIIENPKVKKTKKVKYVVESSSEEEEEIIYVKKKKNVERKVSLPIDIPEVKVETPRKTHREQQAEAVINYSYQNGPPPINLLRQPPRRKPYY